MQTQEAETQQAEPQVLVEPVAVKLTTAARLLEVGLTTVYAMIKDGRLQTLTVGKASGKQVRRVTMSSLHALSRTE